MVNGGHSLSVTRCRSLAVGSRSMVIFNVDTDRYAVQGAWIGGWYRCKKCSAPALSLEVKTNRIALDVTVIIDSLLSYEPPDTISSGVSEYHVVICHAK